MRDPHHATIAVDALAGLLIDFPGLSLDVRTVDHSRTDLLVAITGKLLLVGRQGVEMRILGSLHLQLIVDKQRHIVTHTLTVEHTIGVVLFIGIRKLRAKNRMTVDGHDDGIVALSKREGATQKHGAHKDMFP